MATNISLTITGAALGQILGDSSVTTLERANTIEVTSLSHGLRANFERATGLATGRRYYEPIEFRKNLDRSTPRLREALIRNDTMSGTFRWFRPNPNGDGTTQHFLTITFGGGRITSAEMKLPDTLDPDSATLPAYEIVTLVFNSITWDWLPGGISANDEWNASR
ncbi:MAG: type VI secretion system tube protein TssD [Gemmatimonadota bacterium]